VRAGLVSRADDPANRRRQILELLPDGMDRPISINRSCDEYYETILAGADGGRREALSETISYLASAIRANRLRGISCGSASDKKGE